MPFVDCFLPRWSGSKQPRVAFFSPSFPLFPFFQVFNHTTLQQAIATTRVTMPFLFSFPFSFHLPSPFPNVCFSSFFRFLGRIVREIPSFSPELPTCFWRRSLEGPANQAQEAKLATDPIIIFPYPGGMIPDASNSLSLGHFGYTSINSFLLVFLSCLSCLSFSVHRIFSSAATNKVSQAALHHIFRPCYRPFPSH